ncbi:hypothetical protein GCM10011588_72840 [Nocardia jinanensis]|uniref:Uncharacterized protein n=1 Tax=Nocardia jinanensis TaxID=382504 RepID=A0A917S1T6_9NOCA|nr:hypothetical protein GCM10011588_72840 [Nocardia jinanensis]
MALMQLPTMTVTPPPAAAADAPQLKKAAAAPATTVIPMAHSVLVIVLSISPRTSTIPVWYVPTGVASASSR